MLTRSAENAKYVALGFGYLKQITITMFPPNEPKDALYHGKRRVPWRIIKSRISDGQIEVVGRYSPAEVGAWGDIAKTDKIDRRGKAASRRISREVAGEMARLETRLRTTLKCSYRS